MTRTTAVRILAVSLACSAVAAPAASADVTTVEPSPAEARTFATTDGGWTSAVDYHDLVCIPGVTCPAASGTYRSTGGSVGPGDGYLRSSFSTLLGVLSTTTVGWTSPSFAAPAAPDEASLSLQVRPQIASLLAIGSVQLGARIVDVVDDTRSTTLTPQPLTASSSSFGPRTFTVPTGALEAGRTYRLRIDVSVTTHISAVTSGNVDLDDVALTITTLGGPVGLTATVPAAAPTRVTGTVDADGFDTDVTVDYGTTTAYGSTTSPVRIDGTTTGAQPFSVPLTGLTPGATYHYRVTATSSDGTATTTDRTFVAPTAPTATVPTVSGAAKARARTVTFVPGPDVTAARVEVLDADGVVIDTVADDEVDGSVAITLPDADGTYAVRVVRTNGAGLSSTSTGAPIVLDRVGPDGSAVAPTVTPALSSDPERLLLLVRPADAATVTAQVIDADGDPVGSPVPVAAGMASVTLGATDGAYRVRVILVDAAGNETEITSDPVTLDTAAPDAGAKPTVTGPGNERGRTVAFTRAADADAVAIEVLDAQGHVVDSVPVPSGSTGTVTLPDHDGEHRIRVRQTDAAGNASITDEAVADLDRVAPDVTALHPELDPARSASRTRTVTVVRPGDAATVTAQVIDADDDEVGPRVPLPAASADVTLGADDGDYRVVVRATDAAGNTAQRTTSAVELDATAPAPGAAPVVTGPVNDRDRTVEFTRAADAEKATIEVLDADGHVALDVPVPAGGSGQVALPDVDGEHRVRVRQADDLGNDDVTPSTTVVLDRAAPDAGPAPEVTGNDTARERRVTFVRAADAEKVIVEVLDADGHVVSKTGVPSGSTADVTLPDEDGDYRIRVRQTDAAGNAATSPGTDVTLDRVAPEAGPAPQAAGDPDAIVVRFARARDTVRALVEVLDAHGDVVMTVPVGDGDSATVRLPAAAGRYALRVVQFDAAGNRSTTDGIAAERATPAVPTERPAVATEQAAAAGSGAAVVPCTQRALVLTRVAARGSKVRISGWTAADAGTRVAIVDLRGRRLGTATSDGSGAFSVDVAAPTAKERRIVGYRAVSGTQRSHAAVLRPDNRLTSARRTGTTVTIRGRVDLRSVGRVRRVEALGGTGECPRTGAILRPLAAATVNPRTGAYVLRVSAPAAGRVLLRVRVTGARTIHRSAYVVR